VNLNFVWIWIIYEFESCMNLNYVWIWILYEFKFKIFKYSCNLYLLNSVDWLHQRFLTSPWVEDFWCWLRYDNQHKKSKWIFSVELIQKMNHFLYHTNYWIHSPTPMTDTNNCFIVVGEYVPNKGVRTKRSEVLLSCLVCELIYFQWNFYTDY
jgi:hypothetical protein